eukprot:2718371-Alexandrium_andersonii.AAC.1
MPGSIAASFPVDRALAGVSFLTALLPIQCGCGATASLPASIPNKHARSHIANDPYGKQGVVSNTVRNTEDEHRNQEDSDDNSRGGTREH